MTMTMTYYITMIGMQKFGSEPVQKAQTTQTGPKFGSGLHSVQGWSIWSGSWFIGFQKILNLN
jgi:hypothetical protein